MLLFLGPTILTGLLNYQILFHSLAMNGHAGPPVSFCPALVYNCHDFLGYDIIQHDKQAVFQSKLLPPSSALNILVATFSRMIPIFQTTHYHVPQECNCNNQTFSFNLINGSHILSPVLLGVIHGTLKV